MGEKGLAEPKVSLQFKMKSSGLSQAVKAVVEADGRK